MNKQELLEQLNQLMQSGYTAFDYSQQRDDSKGAEAWFAAWDLVKQLIGLADSEIRTPEQFDKIYPDGRRHSVLNWSDDVETELWNAGYYEQRIEYVREFLAHFPDASDDTHVSMKRAEAEAQWALGRQTEAEATYSTLVEQFPLKGWAYIGWAYQYYRSRDAIKNYEKAEEILLRAIDIPELDDRRDVVERFFELHEEWGQPEEKTKEKLIDLTLLLQEQIEEQERLKAELESRMQEIKQERQMLESTDIQQPKKLRRNSPCWCGSGKKYKHCHLKSDT